MTWAVAGSLALGGARADAADAEIPRSLGWRSAPLEVVAPPREAGPFERPLVWVPALTGLVFAGGAIHLWQQTARAERRLQLGFARTREEVRRATTEGQRLQELSIAATTGAAVAFGTAALFVAWRPDVARSAVGATVAPVQGGAVIALTGAFP